MSDSRPWLTWPIIATVMVALFVLALVLRLPYLAMPMGLQHDEGTARTLVHSLAWDDAGAEPQGFLLRRTLGSPGDRFLRGNADAEGVEYYYSLPPGHPLMAYAALALTGSERDVQNVRVFNLALHAICALLAFFLAAELARDLKPPWARVAGLVAFSAYLFAPTALWYQSNAYTSGSAVQPLFMAALLAVLVAVRKPGDRRLLWLAGLLSFLMSYTEWLGLAFAGVALVVGLVRRRDTAVRAACLAAALGGFAGAAAFLAQYGLHLGVGELATMVQGRYELRSGLAESSGYALWDVEGWSRIVAHYRLGLLSVLGLLGVFGAWQWAIRRRGEISKSSSSATAGLAAVLMFAPIVVHHVVLFDHTVVHSFDVLKAAAPIAVFAGLLAGRVGSAYADSPRRTQLLVTGAILSFTGASILGSLWLFAEVRTQQPPPFERVGEAIASAALPDDVVFVDSPAHMPRSIVAYYSRRDWISLPEGRERLSSILSANGGRIGVVVTTDGLGTPYETSYVGLDGRSYTERSEAMATLADR